ncbi:hypothetical protein CTI14_66875, partial [Methylobacterium radiotolerans]
PPGSAAGTPSKDGWALRALGWFGTDATARDLTRCARPAPRRVSRPSRGTCSPPGSAAGTPSKDGWALRALGWFGTDATARDLTR